MKRRLLPREAAEILGVCTQRVQKKLQLGHFPNAALCECERTMLIPMTDVKSNMKRKNRGAPKQ